MKINKGDIFNSHVSGNYVVLEYKDCYNVLIRFIDTGNIKTVQADACRKGKVTDTEKLLEEKYIELEKLIGSRFTSLEVIDYEKEGKSNLVCKCDCGMITTCTKYNLTSGHDKSCGCKIYLKEVYQLYNLYPCEKVSYDCMLKRCKYNNSLSGKYYKDKGVSVCDEWVVGGIEGFSNFLRDMGTKPEQHYQLDRIDNKGNYSRDNCRWVSRKVNQNNRGLTVVVDLFGELVPIQYILELFDLKYCTVRDRYNAGIPFEFVFYKGNLRYSSCYKEYKNNIEILPRKVKDGLGREVLTDIDKDTVFEKTRGEEILNFIKNKYGIIGFEITNTKRMAEVYGVDLGE